jgi:nitrite reductase (NADH) small subunit
MCDGNLTPRAKRCEVFVTRLSRCAPLRETGHPYGGDNCPNLGSSGETVNTVAAATTIEDTVDAAASAALRIIAEWSTVCRMDQLEPFWGEAALIGLEQLAIFLIPDGNLYAVSNRDPATGAYVMSRGIVGSKGDRHTIASPLHKQVYDLETGECFGFPEYSLRTFPLRVTDGAVQVMLNARSST